MEFSEYPNCGRLIVAQFSSEVSPLCFSIFENTGLLKMIVGVIHNTLQMQPHAISFYGVASRIRFMFLLFPQVSLNQNRH
jgi:hypothetical protein